MVSRDGRAYWVTFVFVKVEIIKEQHMEANMITVKKITKAFWKQDDQIRFNVDDKNSGS